MTQQASAQARISIERGREKPILNRHPWIFSGAIVEMRGATPDPGDLVTVETHTGMFLGRGYWNARSQIQVRLLTWDDEAIDDAWWTRMLARAISGRRAIAGTRDAYRLINAENDFLPGLIVDRYGDWLVLQALTMGIDVRKELIARLLLDLTDAKGVYERSDVDVRAKEGLREINANLAGDAPPNVIWIDEGAGFPMGVDVRKGHKTGYYLDQAPSRGLFKAGLSWLPPDARVLNLFSYTGSFGLHAIEAGAGQVINFDASRDALEFSERIAERAIAGGKSWRADQFEYIQGDAFDFVRDQTAEGQQYDLVICDPPKFAHSSAQVERAARGYKDLNLHSFKLIKSGGCLLTYSCSGAITRDLFQKIVFGALADSGRDAQIVRQLSAGEDHPIALTFPEGEYLKGLLLRVY
ncbi:MAG: class I SAM-dependent rRNA methyltransferase [Chloroflexota bacterium]|nr:class I SAM-dependent rRNA methyltransferase [Chloroflexota bacterium]